MNVVATVRAIVLVYGALLFGVFALTRLGAKRELRKAPANAASDLKLLDRSMSFNAAVLIVLAGIPTGLLELLDYLTQQVPMLGSTPLQNPLFFASVVFGPALVGRVVVALATLPAWRRLKGVDRSVGATVRHATIAYCAFVGPKFGLFLLASAFPPGPVLVLVVVSAFLVYTACSPWLFERLSDTRPLSPEERDRLGAIAERPVPIRVVVAGDTNEARGVAVGIVPGYRRVYLTDGLLDELPDEQVKAIAEHEFAHFDWRHYVPRKILSGLLVVGAALVIAEASVEGLLLAAALGIPYWLVLAAVARWTEYEADRAAADGQSAAAMAGALDALAEHNLLPREHDFVGGLLSRYPSIDRRTAKLVD